MDVAVPFENVSEACLDAEAELVKRARTEKRAFGELYRRHYPAVAAYVLHRLGSRHVAEDVVAEVFMAAMKSIRRYEHRGLPVRAWLYRIATNAVNHWARKQQRWRWLIGQARTTVDAAASPNPEVADVSAATIALSRVSPKLQAVLVLHYVEALSVDEVAQVLGCRAGTVKSRLSRGRDALREAMLSRS